MFRLTNKIFLILILALAIAMLPFRFEKTAADKPLITEPPLPKGYEYKNENYIKLRDDIMAKWEKDGKLNYYEAQALIKMWNDKLQDIKQKKQEYKIKNIEGREDLINKLNLKTKE